MFASHSDTQTGAEASCHGLREPQASSPHQRELSPQGGSSMVHEGLKWVEARLSWVLRGVGALVW